MQRVEPTLTSGQTHLIGVDLGIHAPSACVEQIFTPSEVRTGKHDLIVSTARDVEKRIDYHVSQILAFCEKYKNPNLELIVVEGYARPTDESTFSELMRQTEKALLDANFPVEFVHPQRVKEFFTGDRFASKDEVHQILRSVIKTRLLDNHKLDAVSAATYQSTQLNMLAPKLFG